MKNSFKRSLKQTAEENTSVSLGTRQDSKVIKKGIPLDHTVKHSPYSGCTFGMSKGITKNMDNYESLRVDVWLTDSVQEGETIDEAMNRVGAILDDELEKAVESIIG